jgi:hypothetical protein
VRVERWLPLAIAALWWAAMYPGLYGEDSLTSLREARYGPVSVAFTAWWIYLIRAVTLGTRAIPLLTLFGALVLAFAVQQWASACLAPGRARTLAVCLLCATPLVGALGIQVRHDVEMTAGLLLCAAVATRVFRGSRFGPADAVVLVGGALLMTTRPNGVPVAAAGALGCGLFFGSAGRRAALALAAAAVIGLLVTIAATRIAGSDRMFDPMLSVEWAITDISCLLSKPGADVPSGAWTTLAAIASPSDWPQQSACRFMDKDLFNAPSFRRNEARARASDLVELWFELAVRNPGRMIAAHAERMRLFLPPFVTGLPRTDNLPFLHSTILDNEFGLRWRFPAIAERVRLAARAWNAGTVVIANAALWLIALLIAASKRAGDCRWLVPTVMMAIPLELIVLAAAPMSEGRYGLFILICGQLTTLTVIVGRLDERHEGLADRASSSRAE